MQCVCIGQDHKDSSTKSGRDPSRREVGEGVHRRDGTFQSRVTVTVPLLHWQDNAKKFLSEQFKTYCLDAGILQENTIPETPQQNGLAERCNRTQLVMARCLLFDSGLPKMMWGAAILHAIKIKNLVVRRREEKRPAELMRGIKPKLSISKLSFFWLHSLHEETGQRCQQT